MIVELAGAGRGPATTWELSAAGGKLTGVEKRGETEGNKLAGVRAPKLDRPVPNRTAPPPRVDHSHEVARILAGCASLASSVAER